VFWQGIGALSNNYGYFVSIMCDLIYIV